MSAQEIQIGQGRLIPFSDQESVAALRRSVYLWPPACRAPGDSRNPSPEDHRSLSRQQSLQSLMIRHLGRGYRSTTTPSLMMPLFRYARISRMIPASSMRFFRRSMRMS